MAKQATPKTKSTKTTRKSASSARSKSTAESTTAVEDAISEENVAGEPTYEQISARAYEIYQARKGAAGDPHADWLQAERELRGRPHQP